MKILIATDAWFPQMNGVVRTFSSTINELKNSGHEVEVIHPDLFKTFPLPTYPEIRLAVVNQDKIREIFSGFVPDAIHIATEGTIGVAVRNFCIKNNLPFTTSYTTKFPEYIYHRLYIPESLTYSLIRWFHAPSKAIMVSTNSVKKELSDRGFQNIIKWTRGVDTELFNPKREKIIQDKKPVLLYAGRLAVEKNIKAFLDLDVEGSKYVVGTGPDLESLKNDYPDVNFVGRKSGEELASYYASADVFVFPSLTDTFGLVMLEALASGVPVAAYPVTGPVDVIGESGTGCLDNNLADAVKKAMTISREKCREYALNFSWDKVAEIFLNNLAPIE